jgi:hypothetical protein
MIEEVAEWLVGQGVAVGVLMWFMFRLEKRLETLTDAIKNLTQTQK